MHIRILGALAPIPIALSLLTSCTSSGFECGTPLASDPDQTYTCDRPEEVCICATRSCARPEHPPSDASDPCASGLRYVSEDAFVAGDVEPGSCVDIDHAPSMIEQPDEQSRCPGSPPVPQGDQSSGPSSSTTDITPATDGSESSGSTETTTDVPLTSGSSESTEDSVSSDGSSASGSSSGGTTSTT